MRATLKPLAKYLIVLVLLTMLSFGQTCTAALAQLSVGNTQLAPVRLPGINQTLFAQNLLPTDETPFQVNRPRYASGSALKFRLFQKLPAPFWFTAVTEETGRWETNVFQAPNHGVQDFVFRSLPNLTVGWALSDKTNVYTNYFVIKDIYAVHGSLTFPTTQSLSMGIRRDFQITDKTALQIDTSARELWETVHLHQADLLPSLNLTRIVSPHIIFFSSLLLQLRSRNLFQGATREIDPFYNAGVAMSFNRWNFVITDTYVTNFRNAHQAIPPESNVSMIADFEVSHPISQRFPNVMAFVRAEPIWNWRSHFITGQSGYDFRLYGGFRFTAIKPAYNTDIKNLQDKLRQQAQAMQALQNLKKHSLPAADQAN